ALLLRAQAQREEGVVVVDDVHQGREPAIVIEPALLVRPEAAERRRPVRAIGGAVGLEVVDPDVARGMHVPAGLGPDGLDVAGAAPRLAAEERVTALRGLRIEAAGGRGRSGD